MLENNREDFYDGLASFMQLSLMPNKMRIGIIGGGRGALIKLKYFLSKGAEVSILSKELSEDILKIESKSLKKLIGEYCYDFIKDKHIVVIAINHKETIEQIKIDCEALSKIYISSYSFSDGMGMIPVTRESKNLSFSLSTKCGNPKGSLMVSRKVEEVLKEYDDFIEYSSKLRKNIKNLEEIKSQLLDFIISEDYRFFRIKDKEFTVLQLFYKEDIIKKVLTLSDEVK